MNKTDDELRTEIGAHGANVSRLFDEAKKIQKSVRTLPVGERQTAMNEVTALEAEAVDESGKAVALEKQLIERGRAELTRQLMDLRNY